MTTLPRIIEWIHFQDVVNKWFHRPDFLALRAVLGTARALDIETTPCWMMLIGPSSCGKSELYLRSLNCYPRREHTSDISLPTLLTLEKGKVGQGLLTRLQNGLWIVSDFSSVLSGKEETRNQVTSACREIFDGKYNRGGSDNKGWEGRINMVAACTPAIDRYYRVHADLGERFLQIQIDRIGACRELRKKASLQRRNTKQYHAEIVEASAGLMNGPVVIDIPDDMEEALSLWAEFTAHARRVVSRNMYSQNNEITDLGYTEGSGRLYQEMTSLALGDASLMQSNAVTPLQIQLVARVAVDSLTRVRRAVLSSLMEIPPGEELRRADLQEMAGITHNQTFTRCLDDLVAIEIIETSEKGAQQTYIKFSPGIRKMLNSLLSLHL